jgi:hypothetical protein
MNGETGLTARRRGMGAHGLMSQPTTMTGNTTDGDDSTDTVVLQAAGEKSLTRMREVLRHYDPADYGDVDAVTLTIDFESDGDAESLIPDEPELLAIVTDDPESLGEPQTPPVDEADEADDGADAVDIDTDEGEPTIAEMVENADLEDRDSERHEWFFSHTRLHAALTALDSLGEPATASEVVRQFRDEFDIEMSVDHGRKIMAPALSELISDMYQCAIPGEVDRAAGQTREWRTYMISEFGREVLAELDEFDPAQYPRYKNTTPLSEV